MLVRESRELVRNGKLDAAEAKARQAQRMNVVPAITADRAESVLHEIAMARAAKAQPGPVAPAYPAQNPELLTDATPGKRPRIAGLTEPPPESRSLVAEREANELLAKGEQAAATRKFVEADRLSSGEVAQTVAPAAGIELGGATDPAVRQSSATDPGLAPDLTAPADPGAAQAAAAAPTPVQEAAPAPVAPVVSAAPAELAPAGAGEPDPAAAQPAGNRGAQLLGAKPRHYSRTAITRRPSSSRPRREQGECQLGVDAALPIKS